MAPSLTLEPAVLPLIKSFGRDPLWIILRLTLSGLLAAHGWARWVNGGVVPFGDWLGTQGFPGGFYIAAAITAIEIVGTICFALGFWVFPLAMLFAAIYATGAWLVHWPAGWFVVGLGRNGMEYSVLLIVCLVVIGIQHRREYPRLP